MAQWQYVPSSQMVQPIRRDLHIDPSVLPDEPTPGEMAVMVQGRTSALIQFYHAEIAVKGEEANHRFAQQAMLLEGDTLTVQERFLNGTATTLTREIAENYAIE